MEKYVYKGKNKDDVLKIALEELNLKENEISYKVTEEKGGLFSGKKYVIEIVKIEDVANYGKELLQDLLDAYKIEGTIEKKIRETGITYHIHSNNNGLLIGKNGKILTSIQTFIKQSINSKLGIFVNVIIDVEDYKEKQNYFLEKKVKRIARDVALSKSSVKLDPMNSYERRIVHNALSKFEYITSESEGEEPNRCVVIKYKEKQK